MESSKQTEQTANLTAGGHALPADWLGRIVLIWSGYAVSMFAGNAASYAGIWYATETTGSPLSLAFLYVLAFLPMGLLSPFGGVVADKLNRKVIIVVCDTLMALTSLALAAWTFIAGPSFAAVALYCAAFGLVSGFRTPAYNATMPLLVPERHLVRINSMDTLLGSISMIAGPALGGLIAEVTGTPLFFSRMVLPRNQYHRVSLTDSLMIHIWHNKPTNFISSEHKFSSDFPAIVANECVVIFLDGCV